MRMIATLSLALAFGAGCAQPGRIEPEKKTAMPDKSLFDFAAVPFRGKEPKPLSAYRGQVLLVVNIAANCGYTPQMKPLGALDKRFSDRRFHVLGFLSDDFGKQAGTDDEVQACDLKYDAGFDQ